LQRHAFPPLPERPGYCGVYQTGTWLGIPHVPPVVRIDFAIPVPETKELTVKGAQKPKKLSKKAPQKTLKERRNEKRAAAKNKFGSS
jgi:hypothetical protein